MLKALLVVCLDLEKQAAPVGCVHIVHAEPAKRCGCEKGEMTLSLSSVIKNFYARTKLLNCFQLFNFESAQMSR